MRSVSLKLPDSLHAELVKTARRLGRSKSTVLREALEAYVDGGPRRRRGSCLDVAGNLAGCLEGPGDLSSSRKRMREYGR